MKKWLFVLIGFIYIGSTILGQEIIDSFSDGDFTNSPTWGGNTSDWTIVSNSTAGPNANSSNTLRLNAQASEAGSKYLSVQRAGSWGTEQSWGFWFGYRSGQTPTASNNVSIWLYANESDLLSETVDGYRISFGDGSGDDDIFLERVDNGTQTVIITSSNAVPNGLSDIAFLVRVTRTSESLWSLYTSVLPTQNGETNAADEIPNSTNASVSQGTISDASYTNFSDGYMGIVANHTSGATAREAVEFDQLFFDTSADSPLPVELTKFEAEYANNSVQLNWETATEVNNFGFDIERQYQVSSSEYQEWESIGLVYGHGTTNSPKYYSYIDEDLPNADKLFYRLKQIDNDGTYAYSKTVEVDISDVTSVDEENMQYEFALEQNYPNPFNPVTTISFTIPNVADANFTSTTNAVLKVYNLLGQEIRTLVNEVKQAGSYQIQFDASDLPSGIYFYSLTYGKHIQTRKLALLK